MLILGLDPRPLRRSFSEASFRGDDNTGMKKILKKLIPCFIWSIYHWKLSFLGALIYGFPSRKIKVIGVTGTKGKSTVVMLAGKILEEHLSTKLGNNSPQPPLNLRGGGVGWVSSLTINDGKKEEMNPYHMTMPGRFFIQKMLARMVKNGCKYALIEVTSEGINQFRHKFIDFSGAVFTNLAPEHIEAHGNFENYRAAKEKLFEVVSRKKGGFGVYNLDDENVENFLKYPVERKIGYFKSENNCHCEELATKQSRDMSQTLIQKECSGGNNSGLLRSSETDSLAMTNIRLSALGSEFEINSVNFKTNLLGEFNVYNSAAAIGIAISQGINLETAKKALEKIESISGRLELIKEGQNFTVVVDLAHTPDSFQKVFGLFRNLINTSSPSPSSTEEGRKKGRIISVFGSAGGGRDKWKRPELGKIASQNSDIAIIANEDPYDEDGLKIADDILAGCDKNKTRIILDRRQAIAKALSLAQEGDAVLILGKGTEQTMVLNNGAIKWDDRDVVREELKKII
ncbi:MAG: UDP-N-acetylmuramyl-tripeptide synthetase, UDP-N-acetylmuramoylalanyl-D-glutamate-2,6-diaminopimelate ligase [Parcubacteria group bacterium GW2011_GWC1_43_12]|nr:MAG: UDP-N-acetylmuramyl-tripeptide synthetase, UDP-N-acetylmuramoylalanyl-D-glutamate-2,6-diaminopimelate ligase [Parcubacteria group bacterium GW2011_GWC1_43_12]